MSLLRHLKAWLRRGRLDDELREELAQHVAWKTDSLIADGVAEAEARRRASVEVGNLTRLREQSRAVWGFPSIDGVVQDARYGLRQMRRAPGFTAVAVLSLAIGIGASASVFGLADALPFRKLPVPDPDSLVLLNWKSGPVFPFSSLDGNSDQNDEGFASTSFSLTAFQGMQSAGQGAVDVFAFADLYSISIAIDGRAEMSTAHAVSSNYFDALGVPPEAGRNLDEPGRRHDLLATVWRSAIPGSDCAWRSAPERSAVRWMVLKRSLLLAAVRLIVRPQAPSRKHAAGQSCSTSCRPAVHPLSIAGAATRDAVDDASSPGYLPAPRAIRVDPLVALQRHE